MTRTLTEQKVLKKLQIEDFRHLTKDKVIAMASMLDKMDPEVAKKALEQFPEFSKTMKEVFGDFRHALDNAVEYNDRSTSSYYETCDVIIKQCAQMLEKEDLDFESRRQILNDMIHVLKLKGEKDSENKAFIKQLIAMGGAVATIFTLALVTVLGGNTKVNLDCLKGVKS